MGNRISKDEQDPKTCDHFYQKISQSEQKKRSILLASDEYLWKTL
jgi:hypothetical protein